MSSETQVQERPELEVMLSGCANDAERKAVLEAFHVFSQGDPGALAQANSGSRGIDALDQRAPNHNRHGLSVSIRAGLLSSTHCTLALRHELVPRFVQR